MDLAKIEGEEIVIRLPFVFLKNATEFCPMLRVWDAETGREYAPTIVNLATWAAEVVRELNREEEDGSTAVSMMFDGAFEDAAEQGAEGIRCWGDQE